jgi:Transposase DDE domain
MPWQLAAAFEPRIPCGRCARGQSRMWLESLTRPLRTKDGAMLRTVLDARTYMLALTEDREHGCWLRAERAVPPGRKLTWVIGIPRHLKVYPAMCGSPDRLPCAGVRASSACQTFYRYRPKTCWPAPNGTPSIGILARKENSSSFCCGPRAGRRRITAADQGRGQQHLPGDKAWFIGEHRCRKRRNTISPTCPRTPNLRTLAAAIKARWICEQAHQQMKEELGLDQFEGRSWQGLHRHALMTMIAYAFFQHRRLAAARREKKNQWAPLSQLCPPCATPFSNFCSTTAASSGVSKSAKVVLV